MCGILGFYDDRYARRDAESIARDMMHGIVQRGPDDSGIWTDLPITLGHRRLSILDLSPAGHQPMESACGRFVIAFNGEIYNHHQIRKALEAERPWQWRGHSDTEVMLASIASWGIERALEQFNGMFAFALWDRQDHILTLARDRFGEKPLYYSADAARISFGSELTCLEAFPGFDRTIDRDALCEYFRFKYFPAPMTVYRAAKKLPPAHYLQWAPGRGVMEARCYWSLEQKVLAGRASPLVLPDNEAGDQLEALLKDAVALRMEADVPLGAFLSGGIDSSLVVALMQSQSSRPVRTFSIGFDVPGYNEAEHAKAVAQHLGTDHTEQYVTGAEALGVVPSLGKMYDEPFADASQIPTYLVSKIARQHVTVCLSGDGGDELFGGYSRYELTPDMWKKLSRLPARGLAAGVVQNMPTPLLDLLAKSVGIVARRYTRTPLTGEKLRGFLPWLQAKDGYALYRLSMMAWKQPRELVLGSSDAYHGLDDVAIPFDDFLHRMMYHDMLTYLPGDILTKVDRASMAVSLEGRIPLLDHRLAELSWKLPASQKYKDGQGKWLLRQVLYRHVPKELLDRPKMGFGVPLGMWLRGDLRDWAEALLAPSVLQQQGLLDVAQVRRMWDLHLQNRSDFSVQLWPVLMLQAWLVERQV